MHQIGVVGVSYRHAAIHEVARFCLPKEELPVRLPALQEHLQAGELLYLGTCNRVEVLYATHDGAPAADARSGVFQALTGRDPSPGEASRVLRAWTGEAALEHLFLVACGLDSARTGEREIAAQLRGAWQAARDAGTSGPTLDRMLGEALGLASRVHRLSAAHAPSLADMAVERVLAHLSGRPAPVALIGVSPMTRRCGLALRHAGVPLIVVNRTLPVAEELAQELSGRAQALSDYREQPADAAALVLAAGGGGAVLDAQALARLAGSATRTPLLVDFGVPPNVEPEAACRAGLVRVGMDDLIETAQERRTAQLLRLAPVRAAIDERLERLREELAARAYGPQLSFLRTRFEEIATQEIGNALGGELRNLDEMQRAALQRLGVNLARRLAHLPLAGLRAAAAHASQEAIEAFFREARLRRPPRSPALAVAEDEGAAEGAAPDARAGAPWT
jgi:glutamyl-tRNA reductase